MKRIPIILFFLVLAPAASAQRSIDEVLRQVENASRELEAQRQLTAAQKQDAATGFKVGMSVPLFENKNKVKAAKAAAVSSQAQLESARTNAASRFRMLYDQAVALSESMRSMRSALASQNSLEILGKALDAGQISVIDYFTEANLLFESRGTLLQIERDYQSAVAALYSFSL